MSDDRAERFWGPWATIGLTILVGILFTAIQTLVVVPFAVRQYVRSPGIDPGILADQLSSNGLLLALATIASCPFCIALTYLFARARSKAPAHDGLALRPVRVRTLVSWLALLAAFILASDVLTTVIGLPIVSDFMLRAYATASFPPLLWLALIVAAPLFEEILFRGFLLTGLSGSRLGSVGAITISSFTWSIIHVQYDVYGITTIFVAGLLLGLARIRTGSLYVCIAMHAAMNLVATIEVALHQGGANLP